MASNINVTAIDDANPQKGQHGSASEERASRTAIKNALNIAKAEITALQAGGGGGNVTGIAGFTDGGGFTGNVTNNSLSLTLQYANATQDGQITSGKFTEIGNATANITTLQGNVTNLTASTEANWNLTQAMLTNVTAHEVSINNLVNQTANLSTSLNTTNSNLGNATTNITELQNVTSNLSSTKQNITDALVIGSTNLTAGRGDYTQTAYNHSQLTSGNPHNVTKTEIGLGNVSDIAPLNLPVSNATSTALNSYLPVSSYNDRFKGLHASLVALQTAHATGSAGDYAQVDTGTGADPATYIWDVSDSQWVLSASGGSGATNTDMLPEGSTNLYSTNNRTINSVLTGLNSTAGNVTSSDSILSAIGKITGNLTTKVEQSTTINGVNLSSNVTLTTANISDSTNKRYINDTQLTSVTNLSGTNSGDNATNTQYSGLVSNANHTGDATGATALTLATVNSNVGTFGNGTTVPSLTVNGKGLITAAANNTIPTANATTTGLMTSTYADKLDGIAAGATNNTGTVTQVQGNGTVNGLSLSGNVTTSGNITLGGTLNGTAAGLTAGNVTNIPNLTGVVTGNATGTTILTANGTNSSGIASWVSDETGTGLLVFGTNCTLTTPALGTPSSVNLTNATALPLTSGVTGVLPSANGGVNTSAWVSWTPTFTNFTLGNGTVTAKYFRELNSKTIHYRISIILGSTSSMGTTPNFSLPITSETYSIYAAVGFGLILGSSLLLAEAVWVSTTTAKITYGNPLTTITSTAPWTWTTGHEINLSGTYEAA